MAGPGFTKPRHPETTTIISALVAVPVGSVILHTDLQPLVQQTDYYNTVNSARRIVQREHGILFKSMPGEGYLRLDPNESVAETERVHDRIARTARKGMRQYREVAWRKGVNLSKDAAVDSAASYHVLARTEQINSKQSRVDVKLIANAVPNKDVDTLVEAITTALDQRINRGKKKAEGA